MAELAQARIRNAQDLLVFMEDLQPGSTESILERVSPEVRRLLETASRTSWITIEQDASFVDAIIADLGPDLAGELWTAYTSRFVQTPLMRSLFDGGIRLFGLSVGTFVRLIPRIWTTAYRGAGAATLGDHGDGWRTLIIEDMHPVMCVRPGYVILLRAMFRGMYGLAGNDNEDFDVSFDARTRQLAARFRWG